MYDKFIKEIVDMMFNNTDFSYDRIVFETEGHKIGQAIYKIGGYKGLFIVMNILLEIFKEEDYSTAYFTDLRELECSWSGICEEFQA